MANLSEEVETELEQVELALKELPPSRRLSKLSVLELAGTASLLSSFYHGLENILKHSLLATKDALPAGPTWHRDLLQSAAARGIISRDTQSRLAPYMNSRHFFTHAYGFEVDWEKLQPLVRDVRQIYAGFKTEITRFVQRKKS